MAHTDRIQAMLERQRDRFGSSVTVRRVTLGALTASTGKRATTTADTVVTATRGPVQTDIITAGGDRRAPLERRYTVVADDLAYTPSPGDQVIDGSDTWVVVEVAREGDGRALNLRCRRG